VTRIAESDYRRILGFLHEAGEVEGGEALPAHLQASLASLVGAHGVWYWELGPGGKQFRWGWGDRAVDGAFPAEVALHFDGRHASEDPMQPAMRFANRPVRRSDVVSMRRWRQTGIWHGIDRPLGGKDWIRLLLASRGAFTARLEFDNHMSDFDDRAVAVLEVLTPHVAQLLRRAAARAAYAGDASGLSPRELEILSLVAQGRTNGELARILWISPHTVRKHLENVFAKLDVHTRTAAVARVFGASFPG